MANIRTICLEAVPWLHRNRGPEVVGALTTLTVVATLAVALRLLARRVSGSPYGWDDWLILFALVWEYGLSIVQFLAVHHGFGRHILLLDLNQVTAFSKLFFATTCVFPVAAAALKFSVLFFYHRIFPIRAFTLWNIAIGVIVVAWFIAVIVAQFLTCRPIAFYWDKSIPGGHCINSNHVAYYITSPPDIITNIAILVLPIPWLWNLQMQFRRKVVLTFIFVLGSFAVLGSILRIPFLVEFNVNDASYSVVNAGIWLNVEIAIGILSASLPLMRPLFNRAFPSQVRSRFSRSRNTHGSQRLTDGPNPSNANASSGQSHSRNNKSARIKSMEDAENIYVGGDGKRTNRDWYSAAAAPKRGKGGGMGDTTTSEEGSEEDIIPMGKIQVRREIEWEQERKERDR
ncbi:MAG: hypothetical protein Q9212_001727 [Teloschistes hypoglaucus]